MRQIRIKLNGLLLKEVQIAQTMLNHIYYRNKMINKHGRELQMIIGKVLIGVT